MNHLNEMRNMARNLSLVFALLCALVMQSCKDDDENPDPVAVDFSTGNISIQETAEPQTITVSLGKAALRDGTLAISVAPQNAADVLSVPATVPIVKGNTQVQFKVTPVNNNAANSIDQVTLTLSSVGDGFVLGTKKDITIVVLDDEGPVTASFAATTGSVAVGGAGMDVSIVLSRAAEAAGTLTVEYTPPGAAVTTTPAATAAKITVPVAAGATTASFKVVANDAANASLAFKIIGASEGLKAATTNNTYTLTVTRGGGLLTIAELRAAFKKSHKLGADTTIVGTVISINDNVTNRNVWIHDGTAGILLRFDEANVNAGVTKFKQGDEISVKLTGGSFQEFNGTLQVGNGSLPDKPELSQTAATILGTKPLPAYKTITIAQLNSGTFEGELVKVENVSFPVADGTVQLNNATNKGNNEFTDGTNTGVLRVESYATFKGNAVPQGSGTIMGIASEFTSGGKTTYQVTPQTTADIFASHVSASITVSPTAALDFGDVNNGSESTVQSYTVSGAGLTEAVTVTAPTHYQVSLTQGSGYSSAVSIAAADAMAAPVTVYVKFAPTSGSNQTLGGNITHVSAGAATVNVAVTGAETGNTAGPLPPIRINEIHYDNELTDTGEFIEIMTTNPSLDISNYQIVLYNQAAVYAQNGTIALSAMTKTEHGGRAYYVWNAPVDGIQNGANDGIALVNNGVVVEFLSYEGVINATAGPANGMTSTDIGVAESGTTKAGASLQRKADGTWEVTTTNTKDARNVSE